MEPERESWSLQLISVHEERIERPKASCERFFNLRSGELLGPSVLMLALERTTKHRQEKPRLKDGNGLDSSTSSKLLAD